MKPEQLLVLASARGIRLDLGRPRREIPLEHRTPPRRRDVDADCGGRGIPGVRSAQGKQDRVARAPEWTATDLGFAAAGMPEPMWRALCWAIALEEPSRIYLKRELLAIALRAKERDAWPERAPRGDCSVCGMIRCRHRYVEDLCILALMEAAQPAEFASDVRRASFFGVAEHTWRRHFLGIYASVHEPMQSWYRGALGYLRRRLAGQGDGDLPARGTA